MGKRTWQMESNYHASLHAERQSILWRICHEGIRSYFTCCIIMHAYIYVKFAECIIAKKPLPRTLTNLHNIRQNMAIQLLDASGTFI